jgi:TrmH family RNA methyltransferase
MPVITSRQNPIVRRFRKLAEAPSEDLLLDGPHLVAEALLAHVPIEIVAVENAAANGEVGALARRAGEAGARILDVSPSVLEAMSPVRRPSGIVAIARRRGSTLDQALGGEFQMVLMLELVQDPGNVGAIIRAADACGATGVVVGAGSADPYGWKALRGSMGSAFRLPVASHQALTDAIERARRLGLQLLAAVPRNGTSLPSCDLSRPVAIVLGGEGAGVSADLLELMDGRLTIPMRPTVDSLNVATAAALIAYEAGRQRSGGRQ